MPNIRLFSAVILFVIEAFLLSLSSYAGDKSILNVSYDPTREFYGDINSAFAKKWESEHGEKIQIQQSHGGSGKQARSVIDGLEADIVTLALSYDIDAIYKNSQKLPENWQSRLPYNSSPYTSTIVFIVRKDNPKQIKDWDDLVRKDVEVVTPNPKTSGGARWNYLAAWGYALNKYSNDENKAKEFLAKIFGNVKVLDSGARGATTSFAERGIGDVLITWENEAFLAKKELGGGKFEIVNPSISILAEPPVAVVDKNVERHGTRALAENYLQFLYTKDGQDIAAKHFFRPRDQDIAAKYTSQFPAIKLFTIDDVFGGWEKAHNKHFKDGGVFDQIYSK